MAYRRQEGQNKIAHNLTNYLMHMVGITGMRRKGKRTKLSVHHKGWKMWRAKLVHNLKGQKT